MGPRRRAFALPAALALAALALAGCGGDSDGDEEGPGVSIQTPTAPAGEPPATTPEVSESEGGEPLPGNERAAVEAAARAYVDALNARDGAAVCRQFAPGSIPLRDLPRRRGGCARSVDASLGVAPKGGGPAWKRTTIQAMSPVSVGTGRARVTATVVHDFSDRNYRSVEEDVIYLGGGEGRWLVAKPSGSFYRAVGYPEPPLRALTPP